jgi:hypothetical protein
MCRPMSEGGQRCAAHTRAKEQDARATLSAVTDQQLPPSRWGEIRPAYEAWQTAAVDYASTTEGEQALTQEAEQAKAASNPVRAAELTTIIERGQARREANAAARAEIAARTQAAAAATPAGHVDDLPSLATALDPDVVEAARMGVRLGPNGDTDFEPGRLSSYLPTTGSARLRVDTLHDPNTKIITTVLGTTAPKDGLIPPGARVVHRSAPVSRRTDKQMRDAHAAGLAVIGDRIATSGPAALADLPPASTPAPSTPRPSGRTIEVTVASRTTPAQRSKQDIEGPTPKQAASLVTYRTLLQETARKALADGNSVHAGELDIEAWDVEDDLRRYGYGHLIAD